MLIYASLVVDCFGCKPGTFGTVSTKSNLFLNYVYCMIMSQVITGSDSSY